MMALTEAPGGTFDGFVTISVRIINTLLHSVH